MAEELTVPTPNPTPEPPVTPAGVPTGKVRGGCLTAWLILGFIGGIFVFLMYAFGGNTIQTANPNLPDWMLRFYTVVSLVSLAGVYGTWTWKKWGIYTTVGLSILGIIINMLLGLQVVATIIGTLIGFAILYWLIKPVWHYFE